MWSRWLWEPATTEIEQRKSNNVTFEVALV